MAREAPEKPLSLYGEPGFLYGTTHLTGEGKEVLLSLTLSKSDQRGRNMGSETPSECGQL